MERVADQGHRTGLRRDTAVDRHARLESNQAYRSQPLVEASGASTRADAGFEDVLDHELVRGLLDRLPPRERRIVTLRFFDGLSQERIAAEVGTSQVHVGRLIEASLLVLRQHLEAGSDPNR